MVRRALKRMKTGTVLFSLHRTVDRDTVSVQLWNYLPPRCVTYRYCLVTENISMNFSTTPPTNSLC